MGSERVDGANREPNYSRPLPHDVSHDRCHHRGVCATVHTLAPSSHRAAPHVHNRLWHRDDGVVGTAIHAPLPLGTKGDTGQARRITRRQERTGETAARRRSPPGHRSHAAGRRNHDGARTLSGARRVEPANNKASLRKPYGGFVLLWAIQESNLGPRHYQ